FVPNDSSIRPPDLSGMSRQASPTAKDKYDQVLVHAFAVRGRSALRREAWAGLVGVQSASDAPCALDTPRLVTQVTTVATPPDVTALPTIQAGLAAPARLPQRQLVDAGDVEAAALVTNASR